MRTCGRSHDSGCGVPGKASSDPPLRGRIPRAVDVPLFPGSVLAAIRCPRIHAEAVFLLTIQTVQRPSEKGPDQAPPKAALPPSLTLPGPVPVLWGQRKEKPDSQLEPVGKSLGFGRGGPVVSMCRGFRDLLAGHPRLGQEDVQLAAACRGQ